MGLEQQYLDLIQKEILMIEAEKRLAKIESVSFGYGGYQEAQFGLSLVFKGQGWGISTFKGTWSTDIEVTKHTKWNEADRSKDFDELVRFVNETLRKAKVRTVDELKNIPVEVTIEENTIKSWRVLEEVL
jgi:hypothetical protein